jgi:hypothetical protein
MWEFFDFITEQGLMDILLDEVSFTWSNNQSMFKIGRLLISLDWEEHFLDQIQCRLPHPLSNHFPIMLNRGGSFKFENMWLKQKG